MSKTITLIKPIEGPEGQITKVVLREPRYPEIMLLGEPSAYARGSNDMIYQAEKDDVVQAYIERLLEEPKDRALLVQVSLPDALQLRQAIFDFFREAREALDKAIPGK